MSSNKTEIVLKIYIYLLANKRTTTSEIASRYDINKRTAYRYMNELSCIVPIVSTKGRNGGWELKDL